MAGLLWPYCDSGSCPQPLQTHDGLDFTPNQTEELGISAAIQAGRDPQEIADETRVDRVARDLRFTPSNVGQQQIKDALAGGESPSSSPAVTAL